MADYGTVIETGSCGDNVTYAIYDGGTCVLSGSGATYDFADALYLSKSEGASPLSDRANLLNITSIVIGNGITTLGDYLFEYSRSLTSVEFSETVTTINAGVFGGCSSLTEITFPKSLTTLKTCFSESSYSVSIKKITFTGNAPLMSSDIFINGTDIICYYPAARSGWNLFPFGDYGARDTVTWVAYSASVLYRYGIQITPKGDHALQLRKPKLEIGSIATDWSPAPEDPNEELYTMISVLQTDFSVVQGQIQAKVWETDIEKAKDDMYESITEIYSYINETVNSITAEVGNLTYDVDSLTAQVSTLVITSDEITSRVLQVEQTMATTSYVISQIDQLSDSITATVASINDDIGMLYSQFEMLPDTIKLTVESTNNGSASIVMTVNGQESGGSLYSNGLRDAFAKDTSAITISAGTITFNSNTFIVNSSYFSVTAAGVITATSGTIGGWNITSNALYHIASSFSDYTPGAMCLSEDGFSVNTESGTWVVDNTAWSEATTFKYVRKTMINNNGIQFRGYINESSNTDHVPLGYLMHAPMIQPMYFSAIEGVTTTAYGFIGLRIGCDNGRIQLVCNELDVIEGSTTYQGASGYYTLGNYSLHFVNGLAVEIS